MESQGTKIKPEEILPGLVSALAEFPSVIAIILYGSVARGEETPLSDIDICVLTEPALTQAEWETLMSYSGPAIDLVLFQDLSPAIRYRVLTEGTILLNKDPSRVNRIRAETVREYLDLKPLLEQNARRILGHMVGS